MINNNLNTAVLIHHGIKGQRWGVRRYQNEDGSLKSAGKKRQREQGSKKEKRKLTPERKKQIAKKVAAASGIVLGTAGLTTAAVVGGKYVEEQLGKLMLESLVEFALFK